MDHTFRTCVLVALLDGALVSLSLMDEYSNEGCAVTAETSTWTGAQLAFTQARELAPAGGVF